MSVYIETFFNSLNKYGEELCGDKAEIIRNNESVIIVLADGLGSGVKANILATLTGKIIATMLNEDADIDECLETIASTLPVCSERGIAYSTFTILKICNTGEAYLAEYDNPETVFIRKGKISALNKTLRTIKDKNIQESHFVMEPDDMLILFSDGVVHAGVGKLLNLGWQYENVLEYIQNAVRPVLTSRSMCRQLVSACDNLYMQKPGDDTTVVAARVLKPVEARVMVGPPIDPKYDVEVVSKLLEGSGKKMVCGGTTSQIVSKITGRELKVNIEYHNAAIPPTGSIDGIDLVTEGVLTQGKTLDIIRQYVSLSTESGESLNLGKKDGATRTARLLLEECTKAHFLVGRAMNPAHQNPDLPLSLSIKLRLVEDIAECLRSLGKEVEVEYY
jgi:hypothetical protein